MLHRTEERDDWKYGAYVAEVLLRAVVVEGELRWGAQRWHDYLIQSP